jgi:hypothetical protein
MPDTSGHDATQPDTLHTMTLNELEQAAAAADVLISRRQLMRHCASGTFDAKKLPAVNNIEEWFIAPSSVGKGFADIKTLQEHRARRVATRPDMTGRDGVDKPQLNEQDTSGHDATRPDMTGSVATEISSISKPDTSGHDGVRPAMSDPDHEKERPTQSYVDGRVALLEMQIQEQDKRIKDKDDQILFLKEELTDRRDQIRAMKEIISEQKMLLESMVGPIFRALAKSVEKKPIELDATPVETTVVQQAPNRELDGSQAT